MELIPQRLTNPLEKQTKMFDIAMQQLFTQNLGIQEAIISQYGLE